MRSTNLVTVIALAVAATGCARGGAASQSARMTAAPEPAPWAASLRSSRATPAVGAFVRERHAQLQFCYDDERAAHADFAGKATIAVKLDDDGRVLGASIVERSWRGDGATVEECLLGRVRRWQFPKVSPSAEHTHSFSVVFSS